MDPFTIGLIGLSLVSAFTGAKSQQALGDYQNKIARANAESADLQAADATYRGDQASSAYQGQALEAESTQRAAIGTSGVDVNSGSVADVLAQTREQGQQGAMQIKNNAWREAWGFKNQSSNYSSQGQFAKLNAKAGANATLLAGGFQAATMAVNGYNKKTT